VLCTCISQRRSLSVACPGLPAAPSRGFRRLQETFWVAGCVNSRRWVAAQHDTETSPAYGSSVLRGVGDAKPSHHVLRRCGAACFFCQGSPISSSHQGWRYMAPYSLGRCCMRSSAGACALCYSRRFSESCWWVYTVHRVCGTALIRTRLVVLIHRQIAPGSALERTGTTCSSKAHGNRRIDWPGYRTIMRWDAPLC
jgi:hypothetical protein